MNLSDPTRISTQDRLRACTHPFTAPHVAEWQRLNAAQLQQESANLRRGFAWALLFSVICYGTAFAVWCAL